MRIFIFFTLISLLLSCSTIEVAKEVTKVTNSLKVSVKNIVNIDKETKDTEDTEENKKLEEINININDIIKKEKKILELEKKKEKKIIKKQKKIIEIDFLNKTLSEIQAILGQESLSRLDDNTKTIRFDTNSCRIFLFFNSNDKNSRVKYFEIRDEKGNLINTKEKIQICFNNFDLI